MNNAPMVNDFMPMSPRITSPAHPSGGGDMGGGGRGGGGGGGQGRGAGNRMYRELIGQTVRIIKGSYKGTCSLPSYSILKFYSTIIACYPARYTLVDSR